MDALCKTFEELAADTWWYRHDCQRLLIPHREDAITPRLLRSIQLRHSDRVALYAFPPDEEGSWSGADWDWWFGRDGQWFGLRVQAKKLSIPADTYATLREFAGDRERGVRQVELLLSSSAREGMAPLYCFYNFREPFEHFCLDCVAEDPPEQFGCTLAGAPVIADLLQSPNTKFSRLAPHTHTWRRLVCGYAAYEAAENWTATLLRDWPDYAPRVVEALPPYVAALRDGVVLPDRPRGHGRYLMTVSTEDHGAG